MSFRSESVEAARNAGGSFKTVEARSQIMRQLADYLQSANIQIRHVGDLKEKHVASWLKACKDAGLKDRTLHNRLAAIRGVLREAGFTKRADALLTKSFGIAKASRDGSRTAIPDNLYKEKLANVGDQGVKMALALQRDLGLRQREAVMARADTLRRWLRELRDDRKVQVLEGTKGGRPRSTLVVDHARAYSTVSAALKIAEENNGRLVKARGLKEAIDRFNNQARAAGFVGMHSPHSLRYAYARASVDRYKAHGLSEREALACTSMDLGHGDGRGRWIERVYLR